MPKKKKIQFKADGYLKHSYLGKDGDKNITFQFSASEALQIARLELMSRELTHSHLPVLLTITAELSAKKGSQNIVKKAPGKTKKVVSTEIHR